MRRTSALALPILLACLTLGCARHVPLRVRGIDVLIPRACLLEDPVLTGCDASTSPPKCKSSKMVYRKNCETLVIRK